MTTTRSSTRAGAAATLVVLAALLGTQAQADKQAYPWTQFLYSTGLQTSAAQLPGVLFASPDVCQAGNGGLRGLSFGSCLSVCLNDPACKVASFFPTWFNGPSACFAYSELNNDTAASAVLPTPQPFTGRDSGAYVGVKKEALGSPFNQFKWSTGIPGESAAQLPGPLYVSPETCRVGSGGVSGLTHAQCLDLCLTLPDCKVSSFYPKWFGGPSACFAYNQADALTAASATSTAVVPLPSTNDQQPVYLGVRQSTTQHY